MLVCLIPSVSRHGALLKPALRFQQLPAPEPAETMLELQHSHSDWCVSRVQIEPNDVQPSQTASLASSCDNECQQLPAELPG